MGMTFESDKECPYCLKHHTIRLPDHIDLSTFRHDFSLWKKSGVQIHYVLKYLSIDDQEILVSGLCKTGWEYFAKLPQKVTEDV